MPQKSIIGVIPARWQSSRFPGKPLANLLGKSLIQRTYENAKKSKSLDQLVIATDDERILNHAHAFGATAFMTSPHCTSGTERTCEVIKNHFPEAEIVVNIQGDEPCLNPEVIDAVIARMQTSDGALMTTAATPILDDSFILNPSVVKCVFDRYQRALFFSRSPLPYSQNGKAKYWRHIGIYCFKKDFLLLYPDLPTGSLQLSEDLEQLKILENGFPIHLSLVENEYGIEVNRPEDIQKIETILCYQENMSLSQAGSSPP
jgi:3-deoxy-manno-octulosonate cytidylyltransferase (CMP-KDO synthetase)